MRWKRGLFRIWVVIAGLWVIGVLVLGFDGIADPRVHGRVVKLDPSSKTYEITNSPVYYWSSSAPAAPVGFERAEYVFDGTKYYFQFPEGSLPSFKGVDWIRSLPDEIEDDRNWRLQEKRLENIQRTAGTAILPPAIVLAIGAAFAWAFSGFSRKDEVTETVASRLESDLSEPGGDMNDGGVGLAPRGLDGFNARK